MKFIDEAKIEVQAGHGGAGKRSFRREKFVPLGGPDGGNGGQGGSVILVADRNKTTLLDFHFQPVLRGTEGCDGQGSNKDGRAGSDLIVPVPIGTMVLNFETKALVADLSSDGQRFVIAQGGRGGKGNTFFKTATNRAPEHAQPGEPGTGGKFFLSLKLVADVGLLGFPNAGKSTLISRISAARPKIADYPFTTLTPNLGVVRAKGDRTFVVADIPGLIPGAHEGKGLGVKFLKHVERTRVLAHLIDPNQVDEAGEPLSPFDTFECIQKELRSYSKELAQNPQIVVLTKSDTIIEPGELEKWQQRFIKEKGLQCLIISSVTGQGIPELIETLGKAVLSARAEHQSIESLTA